MRHTELEVKAELVALRALKPRLPRYDTRYAEKLNNHAMLHAQIQSLRYDLTLADIRRQYPSGSHEQGAAEDALYWQQGGSVPKPSLCWLSQPWAKTQVTESL